MEQRVAPMLFVQGQGFFEQARGFVGTWSRICALAFARTDLEHHKRTVLMNSVGVSKAIDVPF